MPQVQVTIAEHDGPVAKGLRADYGNDGADPGDWFLKRSSREKSEDDGLSPEQNQSIFYQWLLQAGAHVDGVESPQVIHRSIGGGRMFGSMLFFAAICSLAAIPALADLVNVSVNGTVSASGSVSAVCNPNDDTPGCMPGEDGAPPLVTTPFSFSASSSQSWSATTTIGIGSVQPFADESTSVCLASPSWGCPPASGDALYVELMGGHSGGAITYMTQETEMMTMSFELTAPADATLYSSSFVGSAANGGEILDSSGTNVLFSVPLNSDASTFLPAGSYELYVSDSGQAFGGLYEPGSVTDSQLYLAARV
jgi:hypothetical protein